jgi:hypothetical protein
MTTRTLARSQAGVHDCSLSARVRSPAAQPDCSLATRWSVRTDFAGERHPRAGDRAKPHAATRYGCVRKSAATPDSSGFPQSPATPPRPRFGPRERSAQRAPALRNCPLLTTAESRTADALRCGVRYTHFCSIFSHGCVGNVNNPGLRMIRSCSTPTATLECNSTRRSRRFTARSTWCGRTSGTIY